MPARVRKGLAEHQWSLSENRRLVKIQGREAEN